MTRSSLDSRAAMMGPDRQLWGGMLAHLKLHHATLCRQWFEDIEPLGIDGGVLRLRMPTSVQRDYLQRQCAEFFNDAARTVSKLLLSVRFFGPDDVIPAPRPSGSNGVANGSALGISPEIKPPPAKTAQPKTALRPPLNGHAPEVRSVNPTAGPERASPAPGAPAAPTPQAAPPKPAEPGAPAQPKWDLTTPTPRQSTDSLVINPDYSFEHFVVGPTNRLSHAAALAVAANPGRAYNPYFVHGGVGLGKTHLLQAICLRIMEQRPDTRIFYTSCEGFITQFMDAVQAGEMSAFRHRFRDVDLLIIDDVHFLAKRDRTQEEFFHTFNSLFQQHRQIVLSSDAPPQDIPDLEERLVSRFKWGLVTLVEAPCYETRVEILKNKAKMRGFELPEDVACYIAARIDSNIRELEGAIVKLQIMSSVENRAVDMDMAGRVLGDAPVRGERRVDIQAIIAVVVEYFNVKITDLQSKRRQRSIALPRQVCMYLGRKHTKHSLEEIGGYFGGRDHTTVMHAVRTVEERRETDPEFAKIVATLDSQVQATMS